MSRDQEIIDVVYTWVDGDSREGQALARSYSQAAVDLNPERTRDLYKLLKYSLRSLQRYAPWLGRVILFTQRPQVPDWLDTTNPRVRVVHHDEVFEPRYLPTFNCNAIESYLHRLPSSSDWILYMNDDFLFGAPTMRETFLKQGRIQIMGTLFGERLPFRIYEKMYRIKSLPWVEHTPVLIHKPTWEAMQAGHEVAIRRTRSNRFRTGADIRFDRLYRYHVLGIRPRIAEAIPIWRLLRIHQFYQLLHDPRKLAASLDDIRRRRPQFYCLNDDQGPSPAPEGIELVQQFLEESYPGASEFEN